MSIPIRCDKCGTMIGTAGGFRGLNVHSRNRKYRKTSSCKTHVPSVRTETEMCGGLYVQVEIHYPETDTSSVWDQYNGDNPIVLKGLTLALGRIFNKQQECWSFR